MGGKVDYLEGGEMFPTRDVLLFTFSEIRFFFFFNGLKTSMTGQPAIQDFPGQSMNIPFSQCVLESREILDLFLYPDHMLHGCMTGIDPAESAACPPADTTTIFSQSIWGI